MRLISLSFFLAAAIPRLVDAQDVSDAARISGLIQSLGSAEARVRGRAATDLAQFGPEAKSAVPVLVKMLADEGSYRSANAPRDSRVYDDAFQCLIAISSESVAELTDALTDPSPDVRGRAAEALGRIGVKALPALPSLLRAANDPEKGVRWQVVGALPKIDLHGGRTVPVLFRRVRDDDPMVRQQAVFALAAYPHQAATASPVLLARLRDAAPEVRGSAAEALGQIAAIPERTVPALAALLTDRTEYLECYECGVGGVCSGRIVAGDAARALAACGSHARLAAPALFELLTTDSAAAKEAAMALGELKDAARPYVARMAEIAERPKLSSPVRLAILSALRTLGPEAQAATPALRRLLAKPPDEDDADREVPIAAACALVSIDREGNPLAWQRLLSELSSFEIRLQRDRGIEVQGKEMPLADGLWTLDYHPPAMMIFETLGNLGSKAAESVPHLQRLLEIDDFARILIRCVGQIGPPARDAVPVIIRKSWWSLDRESQVAALHGIGPDSIPFLVEALLQPIEDEDRCTRILETLGGFGERAAVAVSAVVAVSRDDRRGVRAAAARALGRIRAAPDESVPELLRLLRDTRPVVREQAALALGKLKTDDRDVAPALTDAVKDEYIDVRAAAAEALGEVGLIRVNPEIREVLQRALSDPSGLVQSAARRALSKLK